MSKNVLAVLCRLPFMLSAPKSKVGGQAIIEGVMMRGRGNVSWAIRKGDGEIIVERIPFRSICQKYKILKTPVFRGAVNLIESVMLGYKALSRSADIFTESELQHKAEKEKTTPKKANAALEKMYNAISVIAAVAISIGVFMFTPMWIMSLIVPQESSLIFNTGAGVIRIAFFVCYLYLISLWKEMRRIFEYHGAEHKAIFTFENNLDLLLENMRPQSTVHPRCGTSFLLVVGLCCILLFSIVDTLIIQFVGAYPNVLSRLLVHILLVPVVAGTSYEMLKFSDAHKKIPLVSMVIKPGLWLQKITTREPDDGQLEVASSALKAAL